MSSKPSDILTFLGFSHAEFLHAGGLQSTNIIIQYLECKPGESILEVGFGTGATIVELAHRFPNTEFFGLERSETMFNTGNKRIEWCGKTNTIFTWLGSHESAPFSENQFDKIYIESVLGIQNATSLKQLLFSLKRWLKPEGVLLCNETIWHNSTLRSTAVTINEECLKQFGIIQSCDHILHVNDWEEYFRSFGLYPVISKSVDNEYPSNVKQLKKSKLFTLKGKISVFLSYKKRKEWKRYKRAMEAIIPRDHKLMEGWLFLLKNEG